MSDRWIPRPPSVTVDEDGGEVTIENGPVRGELPRAVHPSEAPVS